MENNTRKDVYVEFNFEFSKYFSRVFAVNSKEELDDLVEKAKDDILSEIITDIENYFDDYITIESYSGDYITVDDDLSEKK